MLESAAQQSTVTAVTTVPRPVMMTITSVQHWEHVEDLLMKMCVRRAHIVVNHKDEDSCQILNRRHVEAYLSFYFNLFGTHFYAFSFYDTF